MKKLFLMLFTLLVNEAIAQSQDSLSLKDLEMPNSPAFILLDQSPTTIERPNSSKAFAVSIFNAFKDNNGIPENYAVDFTPFWFFKHPHMTALKYGGYNPDTKRQRIFGNIARASFSLAYVTTKDSITNKAINNIALGLRLNIITVKSKKDIEDLEQANETLINEIRIRDEQLDDYVDISLAGTNPTLYHLRVQEFYAMQEQAIKENGNAVKEILSRKPVFAIDGALGYNSFFLDNNYSNGHFGRFGAWLTLNWSGHLDGNNSGKNYLSLYAVGRYLSDGTTKENNAYVRQNFYDFGGKIALEFNNFSIAYEYIYRQTDASSTYRSNGLVKYKISDNLFITGAFGKNFGDNNNLISLLGINWGLSSSNEKTIVRE